MVNKTAPAFLFHQPKFIFRNPEDIIVPFENEKAKIYFSRTADTLISLDRSPFGSFILEETADENDLLTLIGQIKSWASIHDVANLLIRAYPQAYQPQHDALVKSALLQSGFAVKYDDISQIINIDKGDMDLDTHKRRRIRKAEAAEFSFKALLSLSYLEESYALIVESREDKDYPVTMTLKDIKETFQLFPDGYMLSGVFDKNKMIATCVSIQVNPEILYCFYIGDALSYRPYSPVTTLIDGIYRHCQAHKFRILDLGLSTDKGVLNEGLYTFKKSFGAFDSHKLTYLKQL